MDGWINGRRCCIPCGLSANGKWGVVGARGHIMGAQAANSAHSAAGVLAFD